MLLPPLCTQPQYRQFAKGAGLQVFADALDISQNVAKTWSVFMTSVSSNDAAEATQGYLLVIDTITVPVGFCLLPRPRWDRIPTSVQSHEERVCEWNFSVCGYGVRKTYQR